MNAVRTFVASFVIIAMIACAGCPRAVQEAMLRADMSLQRQLQRHCHGTKAR